MTPNGNHMMGGNNNPMAMLVNLAKSGGNPMAMIQQMAGNNPQMKAFMQMVNGKNPTQLRQIAENVAKERGMDINQVAQQLGINVPK